jgi:hypothetical protein
MSLRRIWGALGLVVLLTAPALAAPPTQAQLDKAKQAFAEGKKLHDAGKLDAAIEKFKASYELSKNPLLLYNIGLTMEELGSDDLAVLYYRKFLAEAPPDAAQRADVTARIAAITAKLGSQTPPPDPVIAQPAPAPAADLGHHPIDAAPPDKPLDVTAPLPPDGWTVTLYVRGAGDTAFAATVMTRRQQELVGRIPAARMAGTSVQYYLEARDAAGATVAHVGSASVPNVITLDVAAPTQFYPDISDPAVPRSGDGEDPLRTRVVREPRGDGLFDPTSRAFSVTKWSATAVTGVGAALGITMYLLAKDHASALEKDATACGTPPCQRFDDFDQDLERTGKRFQTISNVALVAGAAGAVVAGIFWVRELTAPAPESRRVARVQLAPAVSSDFTGAAAAVRF